MKMPNLLKVNPDLMVGAPVYSNPVAQWKPAFGGGPSDMVLYEPVSWRTLAEVQQRGDRWDAFWVSGHLKLHLGTEPSQGGAMDLADRMLAKAVWEW